jgi:hypothetical protein
MIAHVRARIGDDRAVLWGSSLGGLAMARVAEADPRAEALVLLAPAFRLAERWAARDPAAVSRWRETGWLEVDDHTNGQRARVDFGFFEDAAHVDAANGGWPDVRVPTLIVHGVGDDVVTIDTSRAWAAARPNVRLVEVEDGHELTNSVARIAAEADVFLADWLPRSPRARG